MAALNERGLRRRDKLCAFPGCEELVRRSSERCRHHDGLIHGGASARTFACSTACQLVHVRCAELACGRLCGGGHAAVLRDGLCYTPGQSSCWSRAVRTSSHWWLITCAMCSRSVARALLPMAGSSCGHCGGRLLEAESIAGWEVPRDLLLRWPTTPRRVQFRPVA